MSAHTPGPWKARFEESYYVIAPDLGRVAMMMNLKGAHGLGGRRTGKESAANAHLIAAAPMMFDELVKVEKLLSAIDLTDYPVSDELESVRVVIAKSKGGAE